MRSVPGVPAPVPLYPYKAFLPGPLYWIYRIARTLVVASAFFGFWVGSMLVGWLWMPLVFLWPGTREVRTKRALRTVKRGFQFFHFMMRLMRMFHRVTALKVVRPDGVSPDSPCVLIANHPTIADTTSIVSLFPNIVAAVGVGYAGNPMIGRLVRMCGFVPVGSRMIQDCVERLSWGLDVLIFPEGTRSPWGGGLQPFHRGAFEVAARAKVPVVLLRLICSPQALAKKVPIWKHPDRMPVLTIEAIETIHPANSDLDSRAWARAIELRYHELMGYSAPADQASELQSVGGVQ